MDWSFILLIILIVLLFISMYIKSKQNKGVQYLKDKKALSKQSAVSLSDSQVNNFMFQPYMRYIFSLVPISIVNGKYYYDEQKYQWYFKLRLILISLCLVLLGMIGIMTIVAIGNVVFQAAV